MGRLVNGHGVVVNVDDDLAGVLTGYSPVQDTTSPPDAGGTGDEGDGGTADGDGDDQGGTYGSLGITELKAEIERRNSDRNEADHIKPASLTRKADIVDALEADDAPASDQ